MQQWYQQTSAAMMASYWSRDRWPCRAVHYPRRNSELFRRWTLFRHAHGSTCVSLRENSSATRFRKRLAKGDKCGATEIGRGASSTKQTRMELDEREGTGWTRKENRGDRRAATWPCQPRVIRINWPSYHPSLTISPSSSLCCPPRRYTRTS